MSRNNTGNQIGSKAFPDFEDNVKNLDEAVNSDKATWTDRFGKQRATYQGAVDPTGLVQTAVDAADRAETASDAAFVNADIYATVAEGRTAVAVGEQFQVLSDDGFEYIRYRKDSPTVSPEVGRIPAPGLIELNRHAINVVESGVGMPASFAIKSGAAVSTGDGAPPLGFGAGRAYIGWFDISGVTSIEVSGATSTWRWVFRDENMEWVGISGPGPGIFSVPEGAKYAARTVRVDPLIEDFDTFRVKFVRESGVFGTLTDQIIELSREVDLLAGSVGYPMSYSVTEGASVSTQIGSSVPLALGPGRAYIGWIDVSKVGALVVSGARTDISAWRWVFRDENMAYVDRSSFGNGRFPVPAGAKYAARTVKATEEEETLSTMRIILEPKNPGLAIKVAELEESITDLSEVVDGLDGVVVSKPVTMVVSPNQFSGDTQHERIDNAIRFIKKRGHGILELGVDTISQPNTSVWIRESAMVLPSNCWVWLNNSKLKLADGVFDNIIRNDGIVPNDDPFEPALELNENRNIRIFGTGVDSAAIEGPDVPYTAPHPISGGEPVRWVGDFYGWRALGILLANVKNYQIYGFKMSKTTNWAISQEHGCSGFDIHDIEFDTTVKNGDGVDVRQGCRNGRIHSLSGRTADDTVALSAIQGFILQHPSGNYIYPQQVGGYEDRGFGGDIKDVRVWNIKGRGNHNGVRLLASGGSVIDGVDVDDIGDNIGAYGGAILRVSSGYGSPASMGDLINISVNGISSNLSSTPLHLSGPIKDSQFNYIRQHRTDGVLYNDSGAVFDNVEITNAEFE